MPGAGEREGHLAKLAAETTNRMARGESDYRKWSDVSSLRSVWNERTKRIAALVPPGASVIEFGAGRMVLRDHLPEGCIYTPSDLVDRGPGTLIYDLNAKRLSALPGEFDFAVFSGVLEYVIDLARLVSYLSKFVPGVITSYATRDLTDNLLKRRALGWVNDFSSREFCELFGQHELCCVHTERWRNQEIFSFAKE